MAGICQQSKSTRCQNLSVIGVGVNTQQIALLF